MEIMPTLALPNSDQVKPGPQTTIPAPVRISSPADFRVAIMQDLEQRPQVEPTSLWGDWQ